MFGRSALGREKATIHSNSNAGASAKRSRDREIERERDGKEAIGIISIGLAR